MGEKTRNDKGQAKGIGEPARQKRGENSRGVLLNGGFGKHEAGMERNRKRAEKQEMGQSQKLNKNGKRTRKMGRRLILTARGKARQTRGKG